MGEAAPLEAASAHPPLLDYALYYLAEARRQTGRPDLAADALHRLLDLEPESVLRDRAAREISRHLLDARQLPMAEHAACRYLAAAPTDSGRAEVRLTLGEALLHAGRSAEAEDVLRGIWVDLPASPESRHAQELLTAIPGSRPFTESEQFQRAATLHRLERHAMAIPELTPFAVAGSPREHQARRMRGISAFNVRRYEQAAQWLEPLRDAPGPHRFEALFWLGRSWGRAGDAARFAERLSRVADAGPRSRRSEEALYLLAQSAEDEADIIKSRAYLGRLLREHPNGARGCRHVAPGVAGRHAEERLRRRRFVEAPRDAAVAIPVEFVEDIPYAETRDYVKLVLANYERYRSLYDAAHSDAPRAGEGRLIGRCQPPRPGRSRTVTAPIPHGDQIRVDELLGFSLHESIVASAPAATQLKSNRGRTNPGAGRSGAGTARV